MHLDHPKIRHHSIGTAQKRAVGCHHATSRKPLIFSAAWLQIVWFSSTSWVVALHMPLGSTASFAQVVKVYRVFYHFIVSAFVHEASWIVDASLAAC